MAAAAAATRRMRSSGDSKEDDSSPAFNPYGEPSKNIFSGPWETRLDPLLLNFFNIPSNTRTTNFEWIDESSRNVYVTVFYKYDNEAYVTLYPYKKTYTNTIDGGPPIPIAEGNIKDIYERYPHAKILSYLTLDQIKACRNSRFGIFYKSMGSETGRIDIITDQGILGIKASPFVDPKLFIDKITKSLQTNMGIKPQQSPISCYDPNKKERKEVAYGPSDTSGGKRRRKSKKVKRTKRKSKKTKKTKRRKSHKK
jgi:hypothetical protein